jgi:hypothetical protein
MPPMLPKLTGLQKCFFHIFAEELIVLNAKSMSASLEKIKLYREKIVEIERMIEKQGIYLDTLQTVQAQQLNAESS